MSSARHLWSLDCGGFSRNVFLFPGIMGSLNGYRNVLTELSKTCNVYGLQYPLRLRSERQRRLFTLGSICAAAIREGSIEGSVHLLGWSMGGAVAYECGSALQAAGAPADTVIMVDPACTSLGHTWENSVPSGRLGPKSDEPMWRLFLEMKCGHDVTPKLLRDYDFLQRTRAEKFRIVATHEKKWSTQILEPLGLRASFSMMKANSLAMTYYERSSYTGPVHIIASEEYTRMVVPHWQDTGFANAEFVHVKGDHLTAMLYFAIPPIVEAIMRSPLRVRP